jgi:aspartyl-tRNA(Asn)/glutamyl-tRNA(Gln) amidotransferase subunit C
MASISRDDVAHVAHLARLELTDDELDVFTSQLAAVLEHAADVEALDVHDVEPTMHPYPLVNVTRRDEVVPCLDRSEVLAVAPSAEDGRFRVPPILGEAP